MADVPNLPGVPILADFARDAFAVFTADVLRTFVGVGVQWGIFLAGTPVIDFDSMASFEIIQDWSISDYQVEEGSFQSYNKVASPQRIRVRLATGGDVAARQTFLEDVDAVMSTTDLYDVVTPEQTFVGYNFMHKSLNRRADRGVGLLVVDLWLEEIRAAAAPQFTSTKTPAVAGRVGLGNIQPVVPPDSLAGSLGDLS